MNTQEYFKKLKTDVDKVYGMAEKARKKGFDFCEEVEIPLAMSMAEKVVGLVSNMYPQMMNSGIADRIKELEAEYGKLDATIVFKIGEEVARQKFCKFNSLIESIDAGVRIGLAYITLGVVSSPMEGFTGLKTRKRKDNGKEFIEASFAGPIRSAGTTASCIVLMLIDYLREVFGYAKYDPTEEEIKRVYAELEHFHDRVTNLQYMPTEEEANFLAKNIPIMIAGDPSEKVEVPNYKNLDRVETNYLRSGFCLVMAEGLAQKAPKGFRKYKKAKKEGVNATGFDWLEQYLKIHEKTQSGKSSGEDTRPTYIKDLVAGRPVYAHPSRRGGLRFRYGRGRTSGFSSASVHPATMAITDGFISNGTQLKIEKPTKGCAVTSCDTIEGPMVKMKDGSVKKPETTEEAKTLYPDVDEIIYLGDLLFPFSDLANRNADLIKPGYVEEWWNLELRKIIKDREKKGENIPDHIKNVDPFNVSLQKAIEISRNYGLPLHPKYIFFWNQIEAEEDLGVESFFNFIDWIKNSKVEGKLILPFNKEQQEKYSKAKRVMEILGVKHISAPENVVLDKETSKALLVNLGIDPEIMESGDSIELKDYINKKDFDKEDKNILNIINETSEFIIKDKAGEFIGARMGRPEKAKLRKLQGSPNLLFPVGKEGGKMRSLQSACEKGQVNSVFPLFFCKNCKKETIYPVCENCGKKTTQMYYFSDLGEKSFNKNEERSEREGVPYSEKSIDINHYYQKALQKLNMKKSEAPKLIKAVRGTSSKDHSLENLSKGILRAQKGLQVNKDGTIRVDGTELPLFYFKPNEIGASVKKLRELGYTEDINGKPLENGNQLVESMPHDVLLPSPEDTFDERADRVFMKTAEFVDEELRKIYGMESFYNVKTREDLIGKLGVSMAPHNCAGVVCRIIGFSKAQGIYANPYIHAAIRRDCFDYNTYVPIKQNGIWKNIKIGEIVEKIKPEKIVDNYGTKEKNVKGFQTLGKNKEVKTTEIKNFSKHTKNKMYEIRTSLGKSIKVTQNHKFFINNKYVNAKDIKIGDELPLVYNINILSKDIKRINLLDYLNKESLMIRKIKNIVKDIPKDKLKNVLNKNQISKKEFNNYFIRDSFPVCFVLDLPKKFLDKVYSKGKIGYKGDSVSLPIAFSLEKDLLEIIGLYIAEGYSRRITTEKGLNQVYIASDKKEIRDFIKKTIKKYFGLKPSENKKDRVTFSSRVLYEFFVNSLGCGSNAGDKRIPSVFFNLKKEKLSALLRGYFQGDGSIDLNEKRVSCDSVSEGLLSDLEFCLGRFGIFVKRYSYEKKPGSKIRDFYLEKKKHIPKFKITKLIIGSDFVDNFQEIGFITNNKNKILRQHKKINHAGMRIKKDKNFVYDPVVSIKYIGEKESYSLEVNNKNHLMVANNILCKNCDGDEAALMLLGDVLLNFSKEFLPSHRGGTQDAPLVLNAKIDAGEVDDQILDLEVTPDRNYPLKLYQAAEQRKHSSEIEVKFVEDLLKKGENAFLNIGYTHDTSDLNAGVLCSAYKKLTTMQEKVEHQMELAEKLRAVDTSDTARLVIDRHFIRDMKGNLRRFSQQEFRCVDCNLIMRRPPLNGKCPRCGGKIIFTIHEGGIKKYLNPALDLSKKYHLSSYVQQSLELTKRYIDSIFGKEAEKQENINKWF